MKKRILPIALLTAMLSTNVLGAGVVVNNEKIDTDALVVEGRTLVPVRGVFEKVGFEVNWDNSTKTATLSNGNTKIEIVNGQKAFSVDGKEITPDVPQQIIDGRFYLPLRAISEAIGAEVEWDNNEKNAIINYNNVAEKATEVDKANKEETTEATTETATEKETAVEQVTKAGEVVFKGSANASQSDKPSFIYTNKDGSFSLVSESDRIYVRTLDKDFNKISDFSFFNKNEKFVGYYYDGSCHYIITSNDNVDNRWGDPLYSVEKYNKEGTKLSVSQTKNNSTTTYIDNGMDSAATNKDGVGIANVYNNVLSGKVFVAVSGRVLSVVDTVNTNTNANNGGAYGESFNILFSYDMDHMTTTAPQSFGYEREEDMDVNYNNALVNYGFQNRPSLSWKTHKGIYVSGVISDGDDTREKATVFSPFAQEAEANKTFTLDDFESTKTSYIVAGTTVTQDEKYLTNKDFNLFISKLSKYQLNSSKATVVPVTEYTEADGVKFENIYLVQKDANTLYLMWQENANGAKTTKYVQVDGSGNLSEIKESKDTALSNCKPVYSDGKLVWFNVNNAGEPIIQTINL